MFYTLSKLLPLLLMPLSIFVFMLLFAAWMVFKNKQKTALKILISSLFFLYVLSSNWFAHKVWRTWEGTPQDFDFSALDSASAVVVLGGFIDAPLETETRYFMGDGVDRLLDGIRSYRTGKAKLFVVSGGRYPGTKGPNEADLIARFLDEFMPIPDTAFVVENRAVNTWQNAVFTGEELDKRGYSRDVILVTSASHMPRSLMVFRKNGFKVQAVTTDYTHVSQIDSTLPMLLLPAADNLLYVSRIWREVMGYAYYSTW